MDRAGATLRCVTADMRTGQADVVPQKMDEQRPIIDLARDGLSVHNQFYDCHLCSPLEGKDLIGHMVTSLANLSG